MTKKYSAKRALVASLLVLAICFTSFLATTFAWFTDAVSSDNNIIQTGRLDVEMYWAEGKDDPATATWKDASDGAIFNNDKWEPGYTEVRHIKIANEGTLALQYKVVIVANGEVTDLADVIDVYYIDPAVQVATRDALATAPKLGTLTEVLAGLGESGSGYLAKGDSDMITIALKMQESAGNEYQNTALCDGGFTIQLLATQAAGEYDSFGNDYDKIAAADFFPGFQGGSASIAVALDDQGLTAGKSVIDTGDSVAVIPTGVKLANGNQLELTVTVKSSTESNILLGENEKMRPVDVHIEGVAADNTTPMLVILENYMTTGINTGALKLYHVENGVTVPMTQVATPVNHNEFSYDPMTGDVTLALASFSEVAVVTDTTNPWDGKTLNYLWYNTTDKELTIYNADQLAGFAAIVDGKVEGIAQDNFKDKTVKLANNIYLSNQLFDPIGWGYVNTGWNKNGADGKVFQGTFDGNNKTIYDLYQSGWELEEDTGTVYTYTNCGFGLFAAASNATFKNLTINGAYVRVECVEAGVLVGLSQNNCTYENIGIHNAKIANYQRPAGGLIGEVSGDGKTTIKNVTSGSDVVVGSLWGDFDAPCGGVIGARWDDVNKDPKIEMSYVEVGARMDVYSDVTSAYQWYAYRRAGMLIGNTEISDKDNSHLAAAPFLTCLKDSEGKDTVKVYYGDWAAYHYCQFENQDSEWQSNYPWVRVEAGENCSAYSNPRYSHPVIGGNAVVDDNHTCTNDNHKTEIRFNQLYGGGQGVYGQAVHEGVEVINYKYSITYINDYQVLAIRYITEAEAKNDVATAYGPAYDLVIKWATANIGEEGKDFVFDNTWMNAGSTKVPTVTAGNSKNIVLYPSFNKPYTARFVDQKGNVVAWCLFHDGTNGLDKLESTRLAAEAALPSPGNNFVLSWEVHINKTNNGYPAYNANNFKNYKQDVTVYPVYEYTGKLKLTPIDDENDGIIEYYQIDAIDELDEITVIPGYVNGIPVKVVSKLYENDNSWDFGAGVKQVIIEEGVEELARNSLGYTQDLSIVELPSTITKLGKNTFSRNLWYNVLGDKDTKVLTIKFNGTQADWDKVVDNSDSEWANGLKKGTTVECTDGTYTVTSVNIETSNHKWSWTPKTN